MKNEHRITAACALVELKVSPEKIREIVQMVYDLGHAQGRVDGLKQLNDIPVFKVSPTL